MPDTSKILKKTNDLAIRCKAIGHAQLAGELNDKIYEISYEQYRITYDLYEELKDSSLPGIKAKLPELKKVIDRFEKNMGQFVKDKITGKRPSAYQKPL